jgi:hypothetical protein
MSSLFRCFATKQIIHVTPKAKIKKYLLLTNKHKLLFLSIKNIWVSGCRAGFLGHKWTKGAARWNFRMSWKKEISRTNKITRSSNVLHLKFVCGLKIPPCSHRPIYVSLISNLNSNYTLQILSLPHMIYTLLIHRGTLSLTKLKNLNIYEAFTFSSWNYMYYIYCISKCIWTKNMGTQKRSVIGITACQHKINSFSKRIWDNQSKVELTSP